MPKLTLPKWLKNTLVAVPTVASTLAAIAQLSDWTVPAITFRTTVVTMGSFLPEFVIISVLVGLLSSGSIRKRLQASLKGDLAVKGWQLVIVALIGFFTIAAMRELALLEYSRARRWRYLIGPGDVVTLFEQGRFESAGLRARQLAESERWSRIRVALLTQSQRAQGRTILAPAFEQQFITTIRTGSPLSRLERALVGLHINPGSTLYRAESSRAWKTLDEEIGRLSQEKGGMQPEQPLTQSYFARIRRFLRDKSELSPFDLNMFTQVAAKKGAPDLVRFLVNYPQILQWSPEATRNAVRGDSNRKVIEK